MQMFILKLLVTAALLGLLFAAVDLGAVFAHLQDVSVWALILAAGCSIAATFVSTLRWSLLLRAQHSTIGLWRLFAYNCSYTFYSIVLPGGKMAAEAVRVYQVARDAHDESVRSKIIVPTLFDRITVVFSAALISALFFVVVGFDMFAELPYWFPYAGIGLVALIALSVFLPLERWLGFFAPSLRGSVNQPASTVADAVRLYRAKPATLLLAMVLSMLMLAVMSMSTSIIASALGVAANFWVVFGVVSVSMVAAFLPLTIGGIGVREGVFSYLFSTAAVVPLEAAVSIALITLIASHVVTLFGGLVEFHRHFLRKKI